MVDEALRESEEKHRTLLENLPQKIFFKDKNSVYISCNENYARDLKIKAEEIAGKTDYDFYPKELAEKYVGKVFVGKLNVDENPRIAEHFEIFSIPTLLIFKDGREVDRIVGLVPRNHIEVVLGKHLG